MRKKVLLFEALICQMEVLGLLDEVLHFLLVNFLGQGVVFIGI